jgi:integrase/recombinase XerD
MEVGGVMQTPDRTSDRSSSEFDSLVNDELVEQYREDCEIRGLSPESTRRYISSIRIYVEYLEDNGMDLLGADKNTIRKFLEYLRKVRGVHQKTIENYFTGISGFYDFLEYEDHVEKNPVPSVRKRYLRRYKDNNEGQMRKLISNDEMTHLINSTMDARDKAIIALLAKTGIRRRELITLDVDDIDWIELTIRLKPTPKRTNRIVLFDAETAFILKRWLRVRESRNKGDSKALFIGTTGERLNRNGVYTAVTKAAERAGLHNPNSDRMEDHFSPHCCRHWFTTTLRRGGMPREFIQELRGDLRKEAIDIYDHIDQKELRESYEKAMPQLGV